LPPSRQPSIEAGPRITLATTEEPIGTWLGSTAGMVAADALAIAVGALLGSRLPEHAIKIFAAGAFVAFGAIHPAQGLGVVRRVDTSSAIARQASFGSCPNRPAKNFMTRWPPSEVGPYISGQPPAIDAMPF